MPTFYLDYVNGNDAADGSTFATAGLPSVGPWKTITSGATEARIAPGDTIKIAKSPDPTSLGVNGTWTCGPIPSAKSIVSSTDATPIEITCTGHGYANDDIVFINGHTVNTNANGLWIITKVDDNKFTLNNSTATGGGAGGATGTVCLYTSAVVKLASTSLVKEVHNCDTAWTTADAGKCTCTVNTTVWKEGYGSASMACLAGLGVEKAAYVAVEGAPINGSGFQQVSFWIRSSVVLADGDFNLCLCSDASGDTVQNTIAIPAVATAYVWSLITVDTAGALYNGINSIALYQAVDKGAVTIFLDNIILCKASSSNDSLSLSSLISTNTLAQGGTEGWYGIQSIKVDSTYTLVMLDNSTYCTPLLTNILRGWYGTTITTTTYKRETIKTPMSASQATEIQAVQDSGTIGSYIAFEGGYNTSSGNQDGESFFDGQNSNGYGLSVGAKQYITIDRLNFVRYYIGMYIGYGSTNAGTGRCITVKNIQSCNDNIIGLGISHNYGLIFENIASLCNNYQSGLCTFNANVTSGTSSNCRFDLISNINNNGPTSGIELWCATNYLFKEITSCSNNGYSGIRFMGSSQNVFKKITTNANSRNNGSTSTIKYWAFIQERGGHNLIVNGTFNEGIEGTVFYGYLGGDSRVYIQNQKKCYSEYLISELQTVIKHGTVGAWQLYFIGALLYSQYLKFKWNLIRVSCIANVPKTIKVWVKKSHATNGFAELIIEGNQLAGMDSDIIDTKADDTDWEELSVTSTQTEDGTFDVKVNAWNVDTTYIYIDSEITVT